ncbi:hypothetical protein K438DRAFT_1929205 [Mycena galopus ATCC 62051]|nr:hypothetical protein K438DRAFT_1929205 [Mycena galopus ATCC 62051]
MRATSDQSGGAVARNTGFLSTHPTPIILNSDSSSETEDESEDETIQLARLSNVASARHTAASNSTTKIQTSEPIMISDSEDTVAQNRLQPLQYVSSSVASTSGNNGSLRKRKEAEPAVLTIQNALLIEAESLVRRAFFPTWTRHAHPRADKREAIRLEDIVGPANSAILSSLGVQPEYLTRRFHPDVPVILATKMGSEETGPSMTRSFSNSNWV